MKQPKRLRLSYSLKVLLIFLVVPALAQEQRGIKLQAKRHALVIGNGAYRSAPLKNPINDAEDMATTLTNLGFKIILKKNANQRTMEDTIRYFGKLLRDGGIGLFYYAGHGLQVGGRNYLIPIDARIESESDVKYEAVDAGRVLGKMEDAENQLNIVILDACRNNPYARTFRTDRKGLARMDAPTGSLIAYSTAPGEVAADGPERNGIFTKYLIQYMKTSNLPIEQVLKRVRIAVARQTNDRQIPWESSSLMGDFYFNPLRPDVVKKSSKIDLTSDNQKNNLKTLAGVEVETDRGDSRLKLAILPMYSDLSPMGASYGSNADLQYAAINSLKHVLRTNELFVPTYSFYNLGEEFDEKTIDKSVISDQFEKNLWIKESTWSDKEPNDEIIYELSNKLNIDLAVTFKFKYDNLIWDASLYIIDVKNEKTFSRNDSFAIYSLHPSLRGFTEKVFLDFERVNF